MKYSIIIPTYNHCTDLLIPCIESILRYTDLNDAEIIVSANGCVDNTREYLNSLGTAVKTVWNDQPLGYPLAVNAGIEAAAGKLIVLINNDTVLLPQNKNEWLAMLSKPFEELPNVGISGPVKFDWDCAGIRYDCMAFWLVMISRQLIDEIGTLDPIFSPGMGEDGDFCIRAVENGYKLISVPTDIKGKFEVGIVNFGFPISHLGNGTFNDNADHKNAVIDRNNQILYKRYGLKKTIDISIVIPTCNHFHDALKPCIDAVLKYTDLSNKEIIVVCNGSGQETKDYLNSLSNSVDYIWRDDRIGVIGAYNLGITAAQGRYIITLDDDSILMEQAVDSWINILQAPFLEDSYVGATSPFAHEYVDMGLVLHSGCTMYNAAVLRQIGMFDEIYYPGYFSDPDVAMKVWRAGYKCVEVPHKIQDKSYYVAEKNVFAINFPVIHMGTVQTMDKIKDIDIVTKNRQILYDRYGIKKGNMKYTIIIPTYNRCDELLVPCIESIKQYTDLSITEVIVVANGCTDNTKEYVESLGSPFKLIWSDEALGYTKAVNLGILQAQGEFVILLNNDTVLLPQDNNYWLNWMSSMFDDPKMGVVGPLMLHDDYADVDCIIFFCVMIPKKLFDELGILDEIYTPGGGEDIDFSAKAALAGYKVSALEPTEYSKIANTNVGTFPIWHRDNQTFKHIPEYTNYIVKRNGLINAKRYNKNIKLNLGSGGITYDGYLSVDLHDRRAQVQMDITKLDFDDNSVAEILASHVFEHLNPYHALDILKEWLRVLKPGGKLIMEMPDIEALCQTFITANTGERYGIVNAIYGSVNTTDVGGPDNITSPHLFGWWPQSMSDHLQNAGYENIVFMDEKIPHPASNFRVEASKPLATINATPSLEDRVIDHERLKTDHPAVYSEIFGINSYNVDAQEIKGKTVIDVGANCGLFSLMCVEFGADKIIALEAQPTIYNQGLLKYTANYPMITSLNLAMLDVDDVTVRIPNNYVGSKIEANNGEPVQTIKLETLLSKLNIIGNDLILKIDAEGSEFNILMPCPLDVIRRFSKIYVEVHNNFNDNPLYQNINLLRLRIEGSGFTRDSVVPSLSYSDGEPKENGVYVEKYSRIDF